ncbi:hypothetical protein Tchl_0839 [Thauera chlorobenzoica]|uniref:Uncharacterized protein n=1 Tax=Thauera chlorobenzoica TaxID=96773 RepID=A0A1L6FA23_9RHOO|nr:hypothetical protein Tchl_0839 [Thauera chlorobenzoica]
MCATACDNPRSRVSLPLLFYSMPSAFFAAGSVSGSSFAGMPALGDAALRHPLAATRERRPLPAARGRGG